ncbi:hypothetical protein FP433_06425 [Lactobacillus sp. PV012]|nr:hypothetical protein FP433_06425 [Lactobacillus sp. PV012]
MKNFKSINFKSILSKPFAAGMVAAGLTLVATSTNNHAQAAVTANDPSVVTINVAKGATVKRSASDYSASTGQILAHATSWKVIDSAYDAQGNKWYDLGLNQWVKASETVAGYHIVGSYKAASKHTTSTNTNANNASTSNYSTSTYTSNASSSNNATTSTSSSSYTSSVSGSEAAAKAWIANRESGGSYSATNGQYVGKYQLSASYLNGDYSAANQERVADNYVKSRYGSWTAAQSFWQANGWY